MSPIQKAVDHLGNATRLARALGITTQAVCFWRSGARKVPAEHCPAIEAATGGLVKCEDLRPDVQWAVLRGVPLSPQPTAEEQVA